MAPTFTPRVGSDFESGGIFDHRLLVVGESFYFGTGVQPRNDFGEEVIQWITNGLYKRFYAGLLFVLTEKPFKQLTPQEIRACFDSIAIYNYVQTQRFTAARQRPGPKDWERGASPLRQVLQQLQPQRVLICGRAVARAVAMYVCRPEPKGEYRLPIGEGAFATGRDICHPSSSRFRQAEALAQFRILMGQGIGS